MSESSNENLLLDTEIIQRTLIRGDIGKIFTLLTTSEGLNEWFTAESFVAKSPGGRVYFKWTSDRNNITQGIIEDEGKVLEREFPNHFKFNWHPDNSSYATTVTYELIESPKGIIVRVSESGFHNTESGRKAFMGCATGWGEALTLLKFYVEHGITYISELSNK
ncbi:SRPBCC domain-containing protein [Promethearchaeum syntrophicum]|uniref:SRPBCC domain-containing protein n=1 Tax=Promethearchaeum syntrophicum TaxID=2594042 RepID=A0A5B9DET0_9ARCH|nr:SRPBCC domain-containing protein [Candidatus Prometheoarchaeum syntrophicum]QEE17545.1 hypothetical protein DSAG12_03382 [Candidatus Prometheoarchaeum syntrophicum]